MKTNQFTCSEFSPTEIWKAKARLKPHILRTPTIYSYNLSQRAGCEIYLKMECWQLHGCFKVRGALNKVATLSSDERAKGLITCSSGNHGTALAYAASIFGNPPTKVFLPKNAEPTKVKKIESFGAEAIFHGEDYLAALDGALTYLERFGGTYVHSHGDPLVIAGQGTIGLEIMEDIPAVDAVIVPVGGGGLISGIATSVKALAPKVCLIGIEAEAAPGAYLSFKDGYCHETVEIKPSIADGLMGTLTPLTYDISKKLVDKILLVSEDEIIDAIITVQDEEQIIIEGSAAVGLAAVLEQKVDLKGKKVVIVLTGRNINSKQYNTLIRRE